MMIQWINNFTDRLNSIFIYRLVSFYTGQSSCYKVIKDGTNFPGDSKVFGFMTSVP